MLDPDRSLTEEIAVVKNYFEDFDWEVIECAAVAVSEWWRLDEFIIEWEARGCGDGVNFLEIFETPTPYKYEKIRGIAKALYKDKTIGRTGKVGPTFVPKFYETTPVANKPKGKQKKTSKNTVKAKNRLRERKLRRLHRKKFNRFVELLDKE